MLNERRFKKSFFLNQKQEYYYYTTYNEGKKVKMKDYNRIISSAIASNKRREARLVKKEEAKARRGRIRLAKAVVKYGWDAVSEGLELCYNSNNTVRFKKKIYRISRQGFCHVVDGNIDIVAVHFIDRLLMLKVKLVADEIYHNAFPERWHVEYKKIE